MIARPARVLLRLAVPILLLGSWYPMPSRAADAPAAPPTVTVSQPIQRELVEWDEYTGQFAAKEYVEIRARVSGYLTDIHFEDARQAEEEGKNRFDAAVQAARTRLRPILMTSFAFIFGVVPLAIATGAGAEMRQSLGTAVFFGMLGVTRFGLIFTPVFYVVVRGLFGKRREPSRLSSPLSAKSAE